MITTEAANHLIAKQGTVEGLTGVEESHLEEYLFINKPTKSYVCLVDTFNEYGYTDTYDPLPIGEIGVFNIIDEVSLYTFHNNLLYKGVKIGETDCGFYTRYLLTLDEDCHERAESLL